jgi:hypothetical protein
MWHPKVALQFAAIFEYDKHLNTPSLKSEMKSFIEGEIDDDPYLGSLCHLGTYLYNNNNLTKYCSYLSIFVAVINQYRFLWTDVDKRYASLLDEIKNIVMRLTCSDEDKQKKYDILVSRYCSYR